MTNIQPGLARISWELPETDLNETIALLGSVGLGQGVNIEYGSDLSGELNKRYSPDLVMVVKDPNTAEDISIVTVDHLKKFAEPNDFPMSVATRLGGALIRKYRREFKSNSRVAEDLSHYVFIDNYDHRAGIIADKMGELHDRLVSSHLYINGLGRKSFKFLESYNDALMNSLTPAN